MKCFKNKKFINVLKRGFVFVIVVSLFVTLPFLGLKNENFSNIYGIFVGKKSKYQGIIQIWNIDSFESGKVSKNSMLLNYAKKFQDKNKGLYFMVRDMTEQECLFAIKNGEKPDLISCSFGVSKKLKSYVKPFSIDLDNKISDNFKMAGNVNNMQYGVAWCHGFYFLISTKDKLSRAKVDVEKNVDLKSLALNVGYEKKSKKGSKVIYSLGYGSGKYLCPQNIFSTYNIIGEQSKSGFSINNEILNQSQYSAYSRFVADESVILLGTQRDIARMENRIKNQKVSDCYFEAMTKFSDLIQFFFLGDIDDEIKKSYCEEFVLFVLDKKQQSELLKSYMFPVAKLDKIECDMGIMKDIIHDINANCETFKVF